jgi:hypothetical protein
VGCCEYSCPNNGTEVWLNWMREFVYSMRNEENELVVVFWVSASRCG